jgi:hypothetical protein
MKQKINLPGYVIAVALAAIVMAILSFLAIVLAG